jgi:NADPH:quinone reductase-like Zn-dependent oxidoreductase
LNKDHFGYAPGSGVKGATSGPLVLEIRSILVSKPQKLTHIEAASLATVAQSAWQALIEIAKIKAGQRILIHSGAGGVGTMAVQLAHRAGARVYTTASSENKAYHLSLGADEVIDYKTVPFESVAQSMDLVIDTMGGEIQARSLKTLKQGGMLISTVQPPSQEEAQRIGVTAIMMRTEATPQRLQKIARLAADGELRTVISKIYPLSEVKEVWRHVLAGHTRGKVVLTSAE